jgi:signal transduction histidine kinase
VCWMFRETLACAPSGATAGRHLVADALAKVLRPVEADQHVRDLDLIDDAGLVATELLSNAVHACRSRVVLRLDVHHDRIRIGVFDDGPGRPVLRRSDGTDTGGRGLTIIQALSTRWGTTPVPAGKCVWSELSVLTASSAYLDCAD